jgi:hypothetical protein
MIHDLRRTMGVLLASVFLVGSGSTAADEPLRVVAVLHDESALARTHDIEVRDGIAYLAGKAGSLAIIDVRRPESPRLLWSVLDPVAYEDAETVLPLRNDRLLVGTRDVLLFDVADPARPKLLSRLERRPQIDTINGFVRHGDVVFAANKFGHVFAVDVSEPDHVRFAGSRAVRDLDGLGYPHDVALCGGLLVVVAAEGFGRNGQLGKVGVYRVIDPATQQVLPAEQWSLVGLVEHRRLAGANRVMTRDEIAYVGASLSVNMGRTDDLKSSVTVVDLSDPARPRVRGSVDFPDPRGPNGLELAGRVVFAAGGQTVLAVDVSDPDQPRELARLTAPTAFPGAADDGHDLVYVDGHLFVTAQSSHSLVVVKVEDEGIRRAASQ